MDKKNAKKLTENILKFTGGAVLLGITFFYLQSRPAEKESRNTGLQVMREKITTSVSKITSDEDGLYDYRKNVIAQFDELLYIADSTSCLDDTMIQEIETTYKMLKEESINHFDSYKDNYLYIRSQYKSYIDKNCQKQ